MVNLVIWNEFVHEQEDEHVKSIYPKGIHGCIKEFLSDDESLNIKTATLQEKDHGLSEELLSNTCLLYTSPSPRDATLSRMPSSA